MEAKQPRFTPVSYTHLDVYKRQVSTRWVPRQLTPDMKDRHVDVCRALLQWYETEGDDFLQ